MAQTYCLDESQWKKAIAPVQPGTFIGPHKNCNRQQNQVEDTNFVYQNQNYLYPYQNPYIEPYQHPRYWG
jgi:hypothetical protein